MLNLYENGPKAGLSCIGNDLGLSIFIEKCQRLCVCKCIFLVLEGLLLFILPLKLAFCLVSLLSGSDTVAILGMYLALKLTRPRKLLTSDADCGSLAFWIASTRVLVGPKPL